ncbi:PH domain-containing protein [Terribacillus sp. AE2B 122]|uniref:PH domain-containing protein n=1 Tax=Terribacillus sp. AE2B 122 TaxID=1331902 RepID=UPI001582C6B9|nr:PH domain-containing protein [Terribacillus sp. AE2B 122]
MAYKNVKMTKHIKYIESMMKDPVSEEIGYSVYGEKNGKLGELAATPSRVIFGSKSLFSGEAFEDIYYEDIHYIEYNENYKGATIDIYVRNSGRVLKFYSTSKTSLRAMRNALIEITDQIKEDKSNSYENKGGDDSIEKLQQLVKMKEDGYITDTEFNNLKNKLIE